MCFKPSWFCFYKADIINISHSAADTITTIFNSIYCEKSLTKPRESYPVVLQFLWALHALVFDPIVLVFCPTALLLWSFLFFRPFLICTLQWLQLCRTDLKKNTSAYLNHKAFAQGHNCMWWLMVKPKGRTAGQLWSNLGLLREVFEQTGIKQTTFFQHIIIMLKINI